MRGTMKTTDWHTHFRHWPANSIACYKRHLATSRGQYLKRNVYTILDCFLWFFPHFLVFLFACGWEWTEMRNTGDLYADYLLPKRAYNMKWLWLLAVGDILCLKFPLLFQHLWFYIKFPLCFLWGKPFLESVLWDAMYCMWYNYTLVVFTRLSSAIWGILKRCNGVIMIFSINAAELPTWRNPVTWLSCYCRLICFC